VSRFFFFSNTPRFTLGVAVNFKLGFVRNFVNTHSGLSVENSADFDQNLKGKNEIFFGSNIFNCKLSLRFFR
jgi:hypothetical protein